MKKSLIALAALAATGAFAQSSVTIWGIADAGMQRATQGGVSKTMLSSSGNSSSQLGFRGTEDLGGGMSASFWFEAGLTVDNGTAGAVAFQRRSTLDLAGSFGAIRLGRDYTPSFWTHTVFDPFGTLGSGAGSNITGVGQNGVTAARTSNGVSYLYGFNPNSASAKGKGGLYLQATYAPGEALSTAAAQTSQYTGIRVGYTDGPLNVAVATSTTVSGAGLKDKETNLGGSYDLGVANLMAKFGTNECMVAGSATSCGASTAAANVNSIAAAKYTWWSIGATIPMGAGYIPVSYNASKNNVNSQKGNQLAVGYVHNLSKRTALYTTYSRISNKNGGLYTFNGGNGGYGPLLPAGTIAGKNGNAFDLGIRHSF